MLCLPYKGENALSPSNSSLSALQEFEWPGSKNFFLRAMTSATTEHPQPAWYRRLPRPPTEHNPTLRRSSLVSQHRLSNAGSSDHGLAGDGLSSVTEQFPETSKSIQMSGEDVGTSLVALGGGHPATPAKSSQSLGTAEDHAQTGQASSNTIAREHLCLCPSEPKIPRPRNCEFYLTAWHAMAICGT